MLKKVFRAMACCLTAAMILAMGSGTSQAEMVYSASELSKGQVVEFGGDKLVTLSGFEDVLPYHWYVIDIQGSRVMLMWAESIYGARKFHENSSTNSWARCSLRAWLNDEFYNEGFSEEEKSIIVKSNVETAGTVTQDYVYLLSKEEVGPLLKEAGISKVFYDSDGKAQCWWLRSPGNVSDWVVNVTYDGSLSGQGVIWGGDVVRPVLWIDLKS